MKIRFKLSRFGNVFAFTLAEVLIVIGIVGIIAIMTIPALFNSIENRDLAVQLKKSRSLITNALNYAKVNNGNSLDGVDFGSELGNYVKLLENCNLTHRTVCWHANGVAKMLQRDGTSKDFAGATTESAIAMDGSFLRIAKGVANCSKPSSSSTCYTVDYSSGYCGTFYIDINGKKNPNIYGQDIREINYWADGYVTFPGDKSTHSRWGATRNLPDERYSVDYVPPTNAEADRSCYDGNNYGAADYGG